MNKLIVKLKVHTASSGFTLIELMIIVAVIAITFTVAIPTYSTYSIRSKIGEALYLVTAVKTAADSFCREDRTTAVLSNELVNYNFNASKYVKNIALGGSCDAPIIVMTTQATGARPNPVLTITGNYADDADQIAWTCASSGENVHMPETCRS